MRESKSCSVIFDIQDAWVVLTRAWFFCIFEVLKEKEKQPLDPMELVYPGEVPLFEKYDEFVPPELVRKGFAYGILATDEMKARIRGWEL